MLAAAGGGGHTYSGGARVLSQLQKKTPDDEAY